MPIADLLLAVVRRTRAGRSPFAPDKQHLHHRLLEIGHCQRRAVLIMWLWAGLMAFGTVLVSLYTGMLMWSALMAATAITITLTFLVPVVQSPHLGTRRRGVTGDGSARTRLHASGPCANFHKHPPSTRQDGRHA